MLNPTPVFDAASGIIDHNLLAAARKTAENEDFGDLRLAVLSSFGSLEDIKHSPFFNRYPSLFTYMQEVEKTVVTFVVHEMADSLPVQKVPELLNVLRDDSHLQDVQRKALQEIHRQKTARIIHMRTGSRASGK